MMKKLQILLITILVILEVTNIFLYQKKVEPVSTPAPSIIVVEVFIEPEETVKPRYGFTDDEVYLLAQLLCGSASIDGDGEYDFVWQVKYDPDNINYTEIYKVLCVVMNRVRDEQFPNTVSEVVLQKGQFSPMPKNEQKIPDELAIQYVRAWCDAYDLYDDSVQNIPEDHLYFHAGPNLTNTTTP